MKRVIPLRKWKDNQQEVAFELEPEVTLLGLLCFA
jgi:hypothetical protein